MAGYDGRSPCLPQVVCELEAGVVRAEVEVEYAVDQEAQRRLHTLQGMAAQAK